jgi:hypothetical protein
MMKKHNNDPRTLLILSQIFNHSSPEITLRYIGITRDEIDAAYDSLNLGLQEVSTSEVGLLDSDILEMIS